MIERIEATCEQCGQVFVKKTYNQIYCCPACQRKGQRRKAKEDYYQEKCSKKSKAKKKKPPSLIEINKKARAAGMTYGQYMAKEYGKLVKVDSKGGKGNV